MFVVRAGTRLCATKAVIANKKLNTRKTVQSSRQFTTQGIRGPLAHGSSVWRGKIYDKHYMHREAKHMPMPELGSKTGKGRPPVVDVNDRTAIRKALVSAAKGGHGPNIRYIVQDTGVDLNEEVDDRGNNVLHLASNYGHHECVKDILKLDVIDVDARNNFGETAVMLGTQFGEYRVIQALMDAGCQLDLQDDLERTVDTCVYPENKRIHKPIF